MSCVSRSWNLGRLALVSKLFVVLVSLASTQAWAFSDDFSSDTTANYVTTTTLATGGEGQMDYDAAGQRMAVTTGDDIAQMTYFFVEASDQGRLQFDFYGSAKYPTGGKLRVYLARNNRNYYVFEATDGYGAGSIRKVVNGQLRYQQTFEQSYQQGVDYAMQLDFGPTGFSVEALGGSAAFTSTSVDFPVEIVAFEFSQQDGFLDNIDFGAGAGLPPIADAGVDRSAVSGAPVVLDGAASSQGEDVSYQWLQTGGEPVFLSNADSVTASFDAPIVAEPTSLRFEFTVSNAVGSRTDDVLITVMPETVAVTDFVDDFSVNTQADYRIENPVPSSPMGSIDWDASGESLVFSTGTEIGAELVRDVTPTSSGSLQFDLFPQSTYAGFGIVLVRLWQDEQNFYEWMNASGINYGWLRKVVGGVEVARISATTHYTQQMLADVNVRFSPSVLTVGGLPDNDVLAGNSAPIAVSRIGIALYQQNGYLDNMVFTGEDIPTIVTVGDSITRGIGDTDLSNGYGYPPLLKKLLVRDTGEQYLMFNEGVPGDRASDGANKINGILGRHPDADIVLVQYGTNDSVAPVPSGLDMTTGDPGYTSTFKYHMQRIISRVRGASKTVYIAKSPMLRPPWDTRNAAVEEYNLVIDQLLFEHSIYAEQPDFYCYFGNYPTQLPDGRHPDDTGYQAMAAIWRNMLLDYGGGCLP